MTLEVGTTYRDAEGSTVRIHSRTQYGITKELFIGSHSVTGHDHDYTSSGNHAYGCLPDIVEVLHENGFWLPFPVEQAAEAVTPKPKAVLPPEVHHVTEFDAAVAWKATMDLCKGA